VCNHDGVRGDALQGLSTKSIDWSQDPLGLQKYKKSKKQPLFQRNSWNANKNNLFSGDKLKKTAISNFKSLNPR